MSVLNLAAISKYRILLNLLCGSHKYGRKSHNISLSCRRCPWKECSISFSKYTKTVQKLERSVSNKQAYTKYFSMTDTPQWDRAI